jgi:RNA polymerase sigma-70 factor (ECF subfamily)
MNANLNATVFLSGQTGDHAVILAARRGDERAFGTLFKRYQPKIFAVAKRYTRIAEDAEDIVQQTFQKAFIHLNGFEGKSSFRTWLTRIAINEALMLLRRGRTLREVRIADSSEAETSMHGLEIPDSGLDPEVNYLKLEETEALAAALNELAVGLRTAIQLRELAELSTRETARRMGISVAAAKGRIFHARGKLRKTLHRAGFAPKALRRLTVAA